MIKKASNIDLITAFREDNRKAIQKLYHNQRDHFIRWARQRFDCDEATLLDVYQDAIVALYQNVVNGKIQKLEGSPEAYLFGIARNLLLKKNKKEKRVQLSETMQEEWMGELDLNLYQRIEADHQKQLLQNAFSQLKDSCKQLLELFYYKRFPIESIQQTMSYGSPGTVKTRKVQCLNALRDIFKKMPKL